MEIPYLIHLGRKVLLTGPDLKEKGSWALPSGESLLDMVRSEEAPEPLVIWVRREFHGSLPTQLAASDPLSQSVARSLRIRTVPIPDGKLRKLRERYFAPLPPASLLPLSRLSLQRRLESPEEQIALLSEECDRLERLAGREEEYATRLERSATAGTPTASQHRRSVRLQDDIRQALGDTEHDLERETQKLLPCTCALIGFRTTARLLSESGSLSSLRGLNASRVQLIGSRRRSPGRPPKHGVLYRALGMERLPSSARGAFARSLASLTVPALRADLVSHEDRTAWLIVRKERRIRELLRKHGGSGSA